MSLSKKHYEAVADILRQEQARDVNPTLSPSQAARNALDRVEILLCRYFQADNPSFDPGRFRRAAQP